MFDHHVKVTFNGNDENFLTTPINGTREKIEEYYAIGKTFNFWVGGEKGEETRAVSKLEFLD